METFAYRSTLVWGLLALATSGAVSLGHAGAPPEPRGPLTLRDALEAARVGHPALAVFSAETRAREAHALQAGLLPNPDIDLEIENLGADGDAFGRSETTLSFAQLVELGGKRAKRRRAASLDRDLAGWDYETRRAQVLAEVTKAFVTALAAQDRLALADELIRIADDALGTVGAQVRAGAGSPLEAERARVALERSRLERVELEHELASARAELAASWGGREAAFGQLRGDLAAVSAPPPLETFLAHVDGNPDLARWRAELEARGAAVELERARAVPDVTASLGARRLTDDDTSAAVVEISLPIPLFDRNQGAIAEARHRLTKAAAERAAAEISVRSALVKAYEALHAAFDQVATLRDQVIPRASNVFEGTKDNYARGLFRYLEVLDAQRTLFELRDQYLQALARYHGARADVERLSGMGGIEP